MISPLFLFLKRCLRRLDLPAHHHGMILVHCIVAMHRIVPQEVAEGEEDPNFLVRMEEDYIFTAILNRPRRDWYSVPRQDHVLLEVDVDRMRPLPAFIAYDPDLGVSLPRIGVDAVGVEDLAIYDPGATEIIEPEKSLLFNLGQIDQG